MVNKLPSPKEIFFHLSKYVIGQREAIREISVALAKKLAGTKVGNILFIGSSGSGKTTLMRAVENYLESHQELEKLSTVIRIHANVLGEEATEGRAGEGVILRLLEQARFKNKNLSPDQLLQKALKGIVFVDEVDKIRTHLGDRPNIRGIKAQEALLTLMENEIVEVKLPVWAGGKVVSVDASSILFVCAGAFEGLYDTVFDRVTVGKDKGFLQPVTVVESGEVKEELLFDLRDWLELEDLFDYGMSPQFISRFDAMVIFDRLDVDHLVKIFIDAPDSAYRASREFFAAQGIKLVLTPEAIEFIAQEASRRTRLGARALKEVFGRVIRPLEFDPERYAKGGKIVLDRPQVEKLLKYRKGIKERKGIR